MERSPRKETSGEPCPPILSVAVKALFEKNIPVVEYGQQINRRCGDPVVLMVVEWAVPDEMLSFASQTLSNHGFPRITPLTRLTDRYRQWERASIIHDLHGYRRVHRYPLSFVGLALADTVEVTSIFDPTLRILTPTPPTYIVSLIRHLLDHPVGDTFRLRVKADLLSFISFYILRDQPLYTKDGQYDDSESEEDFQQRVGDAVKEMKTWDWGPDHENYLFIAVPRPRLSSY